MTLLHSSGHSGSAIPNRNFLSRPFLVVDWMTTGVVLSQEIGRASCRERV